MGIYPRRTKDKFEKRLEKNDCIEFAKQGGAPKNAPTCFGSVLEEKSARKKRTCNTCDDTLVQMCRIRNRLLKDLRRTTVIELEAQKETLVEEYKVRAEGKVLTLKLARAKFRRRSG